MAYVQIPKDLSAVETKFMFGFTKRQLICFAAAAAIGLPAFFLLRKPLGNTAATFILVGVAIPAFLFAVYKKNGMPFEKYMKIAITTMFLRAKKRPYQTQNYYKALERQSEFDKEVRNVFAKSKPESEEGSSHKKADAKRSKSDRRS